MNNAMRFADRAEAGRILAVRLVRYAGRADVLVLALPRGGVVVGAEVARALDVEMDVLVVRKLGVPGHEELAMGALAAGGVQVLNTGVVRSLRIGPGEIARAASAARRELARRERLYRGERPFPALAGRTVIVVDDGIATGSTIRAAVHALRALGPARVVAAVPTAPHGALLALGREADELLCLTPLEPFPAVGAVYDRFDEVTDEEVIGLLRAHEAAHPRTAGHPAG